MTSGGIIEGCCRGINVFGFILMMSFYSFSFMGKIISFLDVIFLGSLLSI